MRLSELLAECKRTFLSQCHAEMQRDGLDPKQAKEILDSTDALLDDYNAHVLQTIAGTLLVLEPAHGGGAQA